MFACESHVNRATECDHGQKLPSTPPESSESERPQIHLRSGLTNPVPSSNGGPHSTVKRITEGRSSFVGGAAIVDVAPTIGEHEKSPRGSRDQEDCYRKPTPSIQQLAVPRSELRKTLLARPADSLDRQRSD